MIRSKKFTGMIMLFVMLASTATFAQGQQFPQEEQPQQEQSQTEVTNAELTKFVEALKGVQMVTQQAQQKLTQLVEKEGMEVKRFGEIHQASVNPEVEIDATSEEKATHKKIVGELETMQAEVKQQLEKLITDQGLTLERYEEIGMRLRTDAQLQQRIQQMLQG